jgi:hypothetical protein
VGGGARRACEGRKGGRMQGRARGSGGESPWILLGDGKMGNGDWMIRRRVFGVYRKCLVCLVYNNREFAEFEKDFRSDV